MEKKIAAMAEHKTQIEFLVEDVLRQAQLAGINIADVIGDMAGDPASLMAWALQTQAAEIGSRIGVKYGEAFRYIRFHPFIEALLPSQQ